jgi:hypothetical protein
MPQLTLSRAILQRLLVELVRQSQLLRQIDGGVFEERHGESG